MTSPDPPEDRATLGRLAGSLGALTQQVAQLRRDLDAARRRLDTADVDRLGAAFAELTGRFEQLAETIADALDAASPKGPPAPRWDRLDDATRREQTQHLRAWVDGILRPAWCASGAYTLAECWANHEGALWELGNLAAQWRRIYARDRPNLALALEFFDRWLPSAMRHLADMTQHCTPQCTAAAPPRHRPHPGLCWPHGHPDCALGQRPRRRIAAARLHGR